MSKRNISFIIMTFLLFGCQNESLHDGDEFKPREIHDDMEMHFDRIEVDGIEYLVLEKDYNNPHEGFGFMAFRANILMEKQDTVIAYLKTVNEMQRLIYQKLYNVSSNQARALNDTILQRNLRIEEYELTRLEETNLLSRMKPGDTTYTTRELQKENQE